MVKLSCSVSLLAGFLGLVAGCGGGGGSGSSNVGALALPDRIEITKVDGSGAGAMPRAVVRGLYSDAETDYTLQTKKSWSEDNDILSTVNDILGVVKDTRYADFLNQGPYKALTRDVGNNQNQGGASTTSSVTEELMEVIVDATRASDTSPMYLKVWVETVGPGDLPMLVRGYFTVTEGVSDVYPYGKLDAYFQGVFLDENGDETGDPVMTIVMKVDAVDGHVVIQCVQDENSDWPRLSKLRVQADDSTITSGSAYSYIDENGDESTSYFAFNSDFFKFAATPDGVATVLDKQSLFHKVYKYKLFDADTGAAMDSLESGFPIQDDTINANGYIGYYGLWMPYGKNPASGDSIQRIGSGTEYELVKVGGKLTRHTKSSTTLGDLTNVELNKFVCTGTCVNLLVVWDGSQFTAIGERSNEGEVTYYDGDSQFAVTFQSWEGAWCQGLSAFLQLGSIATPANDSVVSYHAESTIDPSDPASLPTDLYFWGYAHDFTTEPADYGAEYTAEQSYWGGAVSQKNYTFDAATLTLMDGDTAMLADTWTLSGTPYSCGISIGPLLTDAEATQGDAWTQDVYYTWTTGSNNWNQFASLKRGNGTYVHFDAPMSFPYTHATENDANLSAAYDGKLFRLEFDGFTLMVPWEFNATLNEWVPAINLVDGTPVGDTYIVKAIEEGIIMNAAGDPSLADGLTILPLAEPDVVYDATQVGDHVGAVPPNVQVRVIKGELIQGQ